MMKLRLVEGTPPEAEYACIMPRGSVYGERKGGELVLVEERGGEWLLSDGTKNDRDVRPLPPGTVITITVRDAAPHSVCVDKPGPAVEWLHWRNVNVGAVVVSKCGNLYVKTATDAGYSIGLNRLHDADVMSGTQYRRPFDPWHLAPVEEPTP